MISDVVTSIIGHGLATRFPDLRIMPVENGSAWVRPLVDKFQKVYSRVPKAFDEDPMEAFKRCIYVHPFHEEDPIGLVKLIGADNVLFGSDFPHPEGMYDPIGFVDQLEGLPEDDKAKVMGGNLNRIMKVARASSEHRHSASLRRRTLRLVSPQVDALVRSGGGEGAQAVDALDGQRGDLLPRRRRRRRPPSRSASSAARSRPPPCSG